MVKFIATSNDVTPSKLYLQERNFPECLEKIKAYRRTAAGDILGGSKSKIYISGIENGFVSAIIAAYNNHLPLVVRPDDFWLVIMTQFSFYVDANSESLREKFVSFEGKKELKVEADGLLYDAPYEWLIKEMPKEMQKHILDNVIDWILPGFTTTTPNDIVVGSAIMMSAFQKYFDYMFSLCCGIPEVEMLGTLEDWKQLRSRIDRFLDYDINNQMKEWHSLLVKVCDGLIQSYTASTEEEKMTRLAFWDKVCHRSGGGSGPSYLSGWITTFCMFTQDGKFQNKYSDEWVIIDTNYIPSGFCSVPITIDDNGKEYKTKMFSGFFGWSYDEYVVPSADWAICLIDKSKIEKR